jgi:hypothetical protein
MVMKIQVVIFWVVTLCSDVVRYHQVGGPSCLHFQGDEICMVLQNITSLHHVVTQKTMSCITSYLTYVIVFYVAKLLYAVPHFFLLIPIEDKVGGN